MSGRFVGRSVFITGAARGQGRSHALHFAREGASLALSDIAADIRSVPFGLGNSDDLAETVRLCEAEGATVIADRVDVRDLTQVEEFAQRALAELGKIDALVANAGIFSFGRLIELEPEQFDDMLGVNLKGVWHAIRAVVPSMVERQYGRVVVIGSGASLIAYPNIGHYVAAKHAVLGLTKTLALEHAADGITANCVCPGMVHTTMMDNEAAYNLMNPDDPTLRGAIATMEAMSPMGIAWAEPADISKLVLFLASEDSRYISGAEMKIDMGLTAG